MTFIVGLAISDTGTLRVSLCVYVWGGGTQFEAGGGQGNVPAGLRECFLLLLLNVPAGMLQQCLMLHTYE